MPLPWKSLPLLLCLSLAAEAPQTMAPVVVNADRLLDEYVKNHPQDVKQVDRAEILKRNLPSVEEVLKTMPGVDVQPTAAMGSRISIRGSGKTGGVLILLNGRPLNANQYGSMDLSGIPIDLIESVTVFKPPVPVWLGPGGSDGVINIVTRETSSEKKGQPTTTVKAGSGSYGLAEASASQSLDAAGGKLLLTAGASRKEGKRENADRQDTSLAAFWNRKDAGGRKFEVNGRHYGAEAGSAGPLDNPTPDARQRYSKTSVDFRASGLLGEAGTYSTGLYGDRTTLRDRTQTGAVYPLTDHKVGLKQEIAFTEAQGLWELRLSGLIEGDTLDSRLAGEHGRSTAMLGGQYDRRMGDWTATLGLKGTQVTGFGCSPGATAGLGRAVSDRLLLRGRTGYTENVPSFEQLYQTSHGSVDQTRGNPDLREERIWSHELGFEYREGKTFFLQLSLFRADTRGLITSVRGADLIYTPKNLDRAMRAGMELTWKQVWGQLQGEANLILQDSSVSDTGGHLPYTPALKAKATVHYAFSATRTRLEGTARYEGARYSARENLPDQRLHGYSNVDLSLIQPFRLQGAACDAHLRINNLFNTPFESHWAYPDDGFRFNAGIQARW